MLMEASRGGHTTVVKLLIDYPNSISHLLPVVAPPNHPGLTGVTPNHNFVGAGPPPSHPSLAGGAPNHPSLVGVGATATGELATAGTLLDGDSVAAAAHQLSMGLVIPTGTAAADGTPQQSQQTPVVLNTATANQLVFNELCKYCSYYLSVMNTFSYHKCPFT